MAKLGKPDKNNHGHNIDIAILFKVYENINKLKLD